MRLEKTKFDNCKLVIDELDIPVAMQVDGDIMYRITDLVSVTSSECSGTGITQSGIGIIVRFRRDKVDCLFGVYVPNTHEFGYLKESQITKI
jgi:hypothetical protein